MTETLVGAAALVVIAAALAAVWVGVVIVRGALATRGQEVIDEETARERARPHGHAAIGELDGEAAPPHPEKDAPSSSLSLDLAMRTPRGERPRSGEPER